MLSTVTMVSISLPFPLCCMNSIARAMHAAQEPVSILAVPTPRGAPAMGGKAINPTPTRGVRVDDELWQRFDDATKALDTNRSAWLLDAIRWCVREPGAKQPRRPPPPRSRGVPPDEAYRHQHPLQPPLAILGAPQLRVRDELPPHPGGQAGQPDCLQRRIGRRIAGDTGAPPADGEAVLRQWSAEGIGQRDERGQPRRFTLTLLKLLDQVDADPGPFGEGFLRETASSAQAAQLLADRYGGVRHGAGRMGVHAHRKRASITSSASARAASMADSRVLALASGRCWRSVTARMASIGLVPSARSHARASSTVARRAPVSTCPIIVLW